MNRYIFLFLLFFSAFVSCNDDDDLSPSLREIDWVDSLDMTNPKVKAYYEKYGIGLLTRFDTIRDIRYNISSYWNRLILKKLERTTEIDSAITYWEESFFQYFTNADFVKEYFPRKIILAREVYMDYSSNNTYCPVCEESDARVGEYAVNSLHSIYSKSAFAFSVKMNTIYYNQTNYDNYKFDNLYIFLADLFELHNLYDVFGADFYLPSMSKCYGRRFSGEKSLYEGEMGVYIEEGGSLDDLYVDKYWYWNKGFVSTAYMNPVVEAGTYKDMVVLRTLNGITGLYRFPDKQKEVRSMINQMLFVTQEVWDSYPEIVKNRFAILMKKFDEWGIDIRSINPVMEYAFPR